MQYNIHWFPGGYLPISTTLRIIVIFDGKAGSAIVTPRIMHFSVPWQHWGSDVVIVEALQFINKAHKTDVLCIMWLNILI